MKRRQTETGLSLEQGGYLRDGSRDICAKANSAEVRNIQLEDPTKLNTCSFTQHYQVEFAKMAAQVRGLDSFVLV